MSSLDDRLSYIMRKLKLVSVPETVSDDSCPLLHTKNVILMNGSQFFLRNRNRISLSDQSLLLEVTAEKKKTTTKRCLHIMECSS